MTTAKEHAGSSKTSDSGNRISLTEYENKRDINPRENVNGIFRLSYLAFPDHLSYAFPRHFHTRNLLTSSSERHKLCTEIVFVTNSCLYPPIPEIKKKLDPTKYTFYFPRSAFTSRFARRKKCRRR